MAGRYQYLPDLPAEEYAELAESIRTLGVLVPVLVDRDGHIVDGHHRAAIAAELGVGCPTERVDRPAEQLRTLAFELNLTRRHLSRVQKRQLTAVSLRADPQLSDREHGRRCGVDHKTAAAVRSKLESTGEIPQSAARTSQDGRTRPATQPPRASSLDNDGADDDEDSRSAAISRNEPVAGTLEKRGRRRRPLPDQARDAGWDLRKAAERIERITRDERMAGNRRRVTLVLRGHLQWVADTVATALDALDAQAGVELTDRKEGTA
jgi:ParB-like chromosome segregation protein Spo0J